MRSRVGDGRVECALEERSDQGTQSAMGASLRQEFGVGPSRSGLIGSLVRFVEAVKHRNGVAKVKVVRVLEPHQRPRRRHAFEELTDAFLTVDEYVVEACNQECG